MESYFLPVLFTETERKNYIKWALKKEKILMPTAVITILIDLFVAIETVFFLLQIQEITPYFSAWISSWGTAVTNISYFLAIFLTILIIKPLDLILDLIYKKPNEPKMIKLTPITDGVEYSIFCGKEQLGKGLIEWQKWDNSFISDNNELIIEDKKYKIGANTLKTIYPKDKQKPWMNRPAEKIKNSTDLNIIDRNFKGFLSSLEEKKKEEAWINENL